MHILFDIGGTTMRVAALRGARFDTPIKVETPGNDVQAGLDLFVATVRKLAGAERIDSIVGGIAGALDEQRRIVGAPHLPGWVGAPFREMLTTALGVPVVLENDAAVVGLGEATAGAGRGARIMAYLTVSTGVGGARIVDGDLEEGAFGFEPGHQIITISTLEGTSRDPVRLEDRISGTAFSRRFGMPAYEVRDEGAWHDAAALLAVGLNNLAVFWSPEVIVLGGAMMVGAQGRTISLQAVDRRFQELLQVFPNKPIVRLAELGDEGGLHGALALVKKTVSGGR